MSPTPTKINIAAVVVLMAVLSTATCHAFTVSRWTGPGLSYRHHQTRTSLYTPQQDHLRMSNSPEDPPALEVITDPMADAMMEQEEEEEMDEELKKQLAKAKRAQELREQEVFMKKSTGIHKCTNCDWEYDEAKGDAMMIGGMVKPGTKFENLPADWRCPVCRASKDAFAEVVEEIPGFEVNQGYGFGTNSWTAGQKNLAIFGGLGIFFLLFLSGYAMS